MEFSNSTTNFTTGNWSITTDQPALDAHWASEQVLDYWLSVHGRNSLDNSGLTISSFVHVGSSYNNATWVAGSGNRFMLLGDGDGSSYDPFVSLDVLAHEMGHGINEFTAHLTTGNSEPSALNEGLSDIWAACIEYYAAPAKQKWLILDEAVIIPTKNCLRDLANPKSSAASEGHHPNTYGGQYWSSTNEPHTNSTVLSHWFYLVCEGGGGTNDNSDSYSVLGIGMSDAEQIVYRAETLYLTSSSQYSDARDATIQATRDLFGDCGLNLRAVVNAWYAVGIGDRFVNAINFTQKDMSCENTYPYFFGAIQPVSYATNYAWYSKDESNSSNPFVLRESGSSTSADFPLGTNHGDRYFTIRVVATIGSSCDIQSVDEDGYLFAESCIGGRSMGIIASPNPSKGSVVISLLDENNKPVTAIHQMLFEIRLVNKQGVLRKVFKYPKGTKQQTINISDLPADIYAVQGFDGVTWHTIQLIKN